MRKFLFLLTCFIFSLSAFSQTDSAVYTPKTTRLYFSWGTDVTPILLSQYGDKKDVVLINLHSDELTSIEAAKSVLTQKGGLLIQIDNNKKRLITFTRKNKKYSFDPNRIFTSKGLRDNLRKSNKKFTKTTVFLTESFARFILAQIPKTAKVVIAIHNNTNGSYSIKSYRSAANHALDTKKLHINKKTDPDDFILTTNTRIYNDVRKKNYNVILQNNQRAANDGSLSVYYGKKKKTYINAEAEHGHSDQQSKMLQALLIIINKERK